MSEDEVAWIRLKGWMGQGGAIWEGREGWEEEGSGLGEGLVSLLVLSRLASFQEFRTLPFFSFLQFAAGNQKREDGKIRVREGKKR